MKYFNHILDSTQQTFSSHELHIIFAIELTYFLVLIATISHEHTIIIVIAFFLMKTYTFLSAELKYVFINNYLSLNADFFSSL